MLTINGKQRELPAGTTLTGYLEMEFNILANGIKLVGALLMMLAYSPVMTVVACGFFVLPIGVSYLTGNFRADLL